MLTEPAYGGRYWVVFFYFMVIAMAFAGTGLVRMAFGHDPATEDGRDSDTPPAGATAT